MLDLGWPELLVVALVLIIVVGPKDLPGMLRTFGRTTRKLRSMAGEFRSQFDEALKEAELEDVKNVLDEAKQLNPKNILKEAIDPIRDAGKEIKADLDKAMREPAEPAKPELAATNVKSEPGSDKAPKPAGKKAAKSAKKPSTGKAASKTAKTGAGKPARSTTRKPAAKKTNSTAKPASEAKKPARRAATRKAAPAAKAAKSSGDTA
ncbi:Sec-independent protein translocase protein TatB [Nitratireductor sp. XY-223]|uniref:Sec-independent protein translocase protein TatB n=1 Tax=Nitratireductor sp. XY-223 TaxID=2561926 RepID=UPI0010AA7990|nr:Sec-independent protein translocase protein TatB [Nitratireductor sp. XY-223]